MKYIKLIVVFCLTLVFLPGIAPAQDSTIIDINAIVVDTHNIPVGGAVISNRSAEAVISDNTGAFSIQVPVNSSLTISASGYNNLVVIATEDLEVIALEPSTVQLPFRQVNQRDLVGAVTVIDGDELIRKGYSSNPLDGLHALVGGFNGNSIWGMENPLLVVDGIPRDINNINLTEVDQIAVLKGAGAIALYGTHATNGVIYITTKRGQVGDQQVDVRVNSGIYQSKMLPNYIGSSEYLTLYNEARLNDGLGYFDNQSIIENTASGTNPYRYPDIDFYSSEFIRNIYNRSDITTEIYGGDKYARYYTNIGYMRQGSMLNFGEGANSFDQRFNLRGNVNSDLTDWLKVSVDAVAIFSEGRNPHTDYWQQASVIRPNRFSPLVPISMIDMSNDQNQIYVDNTENKIDDLYILGGSQLDMTNAFADIYAGGYNKEINRQFMFNPNIDADLSGITPGLAFRSKFGVDYSTTYNQGYRFNYVVFQPSWNTIDGEDVIQSLSRWGEQEYRNNTQYIDNSWYQQLLYVSSQLDYQRTFNEEHNLFTMLVANGYQYSVSGLYQNISNSNLGYYLGYNFRNKYYVDFNSSLMYSSRVAPGNRMAFSPVISLGWRISDETFMEGATYIDNLKLTSTLGRIHSDASIEAEIDDVTYTHYLYASRYNYNNTNWFSWGADRGRDVTASLLGPNPDLKLPYRDELSLGFETALFNRFINLEANYFSITHKGGPVSATALFPSYFMTDQPRSSFVPYLNYNEERRTGFDFNLRFNQQSGNVSWILGVAGTFYNTEILKRPELYELEYQSRVGNALDGVWGLETIGFFADEIDIENSPTQFGTLKPGDLKYVDQNDDGVINELDEIFLGPGGWFGSPNTLGVNITTRWRNLTFFAQGVGRWGAYGMRSRTTDWVFGDRKYSDVVYDRWAYYTDPITGETVDTRATATYPRLSTQSGDNNFRNSDFWQINTDRFDIARIQLTYSFPQSILGNGLFRNIDIYVAGSNLFTISSERKYLETNVGQAPQMRFYNLGLSAAF